MNAHNPEIDSAYNRLFKLWHHPKYKKKYRLKIRLACKNIIDAKTLKKWLECKDSFYNAYYKEKILDVSNGVRSNKIQEKLDAYSFMLSQLKRSEFSQEHLLQLENTYSVFHNISELKFEKLTFKTFKKPLAIFFVYIYSYRAQRGYCDGMVFENNGRLILAGLSNNAMSIGHFGKFEANSEILFGTITIDDSFSKKVHRSNIALVKLGSETSQRNMRLVDQHINGSYREMNY